MEISEGSSKLNPKREGDELVEGPEGVSGTAVEKKKETITRVVCL